MSEAYDAQPRLPKAGEGKLYPLSFEQQSLYTVELYSQGSMFSARALLHLALRLRGPLRVDTLQAAFDDVVARHGALRTRFVAAPDDDILQEELPEARRQIELLDEPGEASSLDALSRLGETPISFDAPPLARALLQRVGTDEHLLFLAVHHLATDATGLWIALEDLRQAYEARLRGEALPPLPLTYGEYALWQVASCAPRLEADREFWQQYLAGLAPYEIRQDMPFQAGPAPWAMSEVRMELLGNERFQAFQRFARRERTSPLVAFQAGFQALLSARAESEEHLTVTYFDQREHPQARQMVGYFIRHVPLRTRLAMDRPIRHSLPDMTQQIIAAHQRAYVPIPYILGAYPEAMPSLLGQCAPWITFLQYLPQSEPPCLRFGEAEGQVLHSGVSSRQEPGLSLRLRRRPDGSLWLRLGYDARHWRKETMEQLAASYSRMLQAMMEDASRTPRSLLELAGKW